jgi:hypothetical protein
MRKLATFLLFVTMLLPMGAAQNPGMPSKEDRAIGALRTINTAQVQYWTKYGLSKDFACNLEQLGPPADGQKRSRAAAGLINEKLASGVLEGYRLELKCGDDDYQAFAVPTEQSRAAFCIDKSAVVRTSDSADTCIKDGVIPKRPKATNGQ